MNPPTVWALSVWALSCSAAVSIETSSRIFTDALRTGSIFLGIYLLLVAAIVVFAATIGGHMSPLLLVFPALPWSLLGNLLLGSDGLGIGTWVGVALNAVLVFGLGYICQR